MVSFLNPFLGKVYPSPYPTLGNSPQSHASPANPSQAKPSQDQPRSAMASQNRPIQAQPSPTKPHQARPGWVPRGLDRIGTAKSLISSMTCVKNRCRAISARPANQSQGKWRGFARQVRGSPLPGPSTPRLAAP